jgi:hypothetical protein
MEMRDKIRRFGTSFNLKKSWWRLRPLRAVWSFEGWMKLDPVPCAAREFVTG